jgi:ribosome-binding protein aMBF1 (putative translation factor)
MGHKPKKCQGCKEKPNDDNLWQCPICGRWLCNCAGWTQELDHNDNEILVCDKCYREKNGITDYNR